MSIPVADATRLPTHHTPVADAARLPNHHKLVVDAARLPKRQDRLTIVAVALIVPVLTGCHQLAERHATASSPAPPVTSPAGGVTPAGNVVHADGNASLPSYVRNASTVVPTAGAEVVPAAADTPATSSEDTYTSYQPPLPGDPYVSPFPTSPLPVGPGGDILNAPPQQPVMPPIRDADLIVNGYPARTGRIMFGGAVNSDAGVTGQVTIDERNFDITRLPTSFQDLIGGTAFRGAGQTLRLELVPGNQFQRYMAQFSDPNLFGYLPISMSVSGFLFDRRYNDWDEERLGGRLSFGYRVTPDLSVSAGVSGQNVEVSRPRVLGVPQLDSVLGDNELYSGHVALTHDTRDSPIQAGAGHYFEFRFEEVFGDFDYARFETEFRQYWLLAQRADGSGRQTLSYSTQLGFSGEETPIFENFFAGGYATLRGFDFRGASPSVGGIEVGGRFQWLNSVEYVFPITADDAFRGVTFVDFGTVEQDIEINGDNFRVAPGVGLRVAIPMMGPAPLAFDFAFPVAKADTDDERMFSFYMSVIR